MRIVKKAAPGVPLSVVGTLTPNESDLLRQRWVEGCRAEHSQADGVIKRIRAEGHWIQCSCSKGNVLGPVLVPRLTPNGNAALVRTPERGSHAADCVFAWEEGELGTQSTKLHKGGAQTPPRFLPLSSQDPTEPSAKQSHTAPYEHDWLSRCMLWLLQSAGCCDLAVEPSTTSIREGFAAIDNFAASHPIGNGMVLKDILWTSEKAVFTGRALRTFRDGLPNWPKMPKHGFVFALPTAISDRTVTLRDYVINLGLPPTFISGIDHSEGPFLMLIKIEYDEDKQRCQFASASVVLRKKGCLVPYWGSEDAKLEKAIQWCIGKAALDGIVVTADTLLGMPLRKTERVPYARVRTGESSLVIADSSEKPLPLWVKGSEAEVISLHSYEKNDIHEVITKTMQWIRSRQ